MEQKETQNPEPEFLVGQRVRVVQSKRNITAHTGTIRDIVWHFKDSKYNYYLEENGKKVSKRYSTDDLEAVD